MSAWLTATSRIQASDWEAIRRQNARNAYEVQKETSKSNESLIKRLEALLLGELTEAEEIETIEAHKEAIEPLQSERMPFVQLPLGQTLEETIDAWKEVRKDAVSELPKAAPKVVAEMAQASAAIREATSVIALHNRAKAFADLQPLGRPLPYTSNNLGRIDNMIERYAREQYTSYDAMSRRVSDYFSPTVYATA